MIKIKKENISGFIELLMKDFTVYAPVTSGKKTTFQAVSSAGEILSGHVNTDHSPKKVFFPQSEVLFEFDDKGILKVPEKDIKPFAIWGVRNCDVKSIRMLDKVFGTARQDPGKEMYKDPYWKMKYDASMIFNFACNEPLSTCFCNWFSGGPFDETGSDVFVVESAEYYFFKGVSEKGIGFIGKLKDYDEAEDKDIDIISKQKANAESLMEEKIDTSGLFEKLSKLWNEPVWEEISAKCVNCAACAFVCPTCHCFDVSDEGKHGKGKRVRLWDSCMFSIFTKEASGHNPRGNSVQRVRQRIMHKYNYFNDNYGTHLCTGCGRCVTVCPVNLDIREVIKQILNYEIKEKVSSDV